MYGVSKMLLSQPFAFNLCMDREQSEIRPVEDVSNFTTCGLTHDSEYNSVEDAYAAYLSYAKGVGFSVRKNHLSKDKQGVVRNVRFVCCKEGWRKKDPRYSNPIIKRAET